MIRSAQHGNGRNRHSEARTKSVPGIQSLRITILLRVMHVRLIYRFKASRLAELVRDIERLAASQCLAWWSACEKFG
jgi:hypothetical protein